ncbi:MAG: helix-turn-helix transcriptional regulator [Bacteroidia bacterium]|nr:helix-turn-helix transcriptional regulator [Bacteroidia bacterium]MCF8427360.1 helix-turn-helix transcriptional regulator [Bacteroidia bacterium]MCF8447866.1 helix-turn-helix transcriptional regulator [Bacteroidia bacterium]
MGKKVFKDLISNEKSKVHDLIAFRKTNKAWLKKSMQIAIAILKVLRERNVTQVELAAKLEVSPQYINKIVKGQENLTLETIAKLEEILKINLISIEPFQYKSEAIKSISLPNIIDKSKYQSIYFATKPIERLTFQSPKGEATNFAESA